MNLINQYIKNIIKIKFQILATIIAIVFMTILHANNNINQKQKTLNDIDAEILKIHIPHLKIINGVGHSPIPLLNELAETLRSRGLISIK